MMIIDINKHLRYYEAEIFYGFIMAITPLALRHTKSSNEKCPSCRVGMSNKQRAVVVHQNPNDPEGPYIHPIHKKCLLDGYRVNQIANCYLCRAPLDIQVFLPAGSPHRGPMVRNPDDTSVIHQIAYGMYGSLVPTAGVTMLSTLGLIQTIQNNQTNIIERWFQVPTALEFGAVLASGLYPLPLGFLDQNERMNVIRDCAMALIALAVVHGDFYPDRIAALVAIGRLAPLGAQFIPFPSEEIRDLAQEQWRKVINTLPLLKKEMIMGAIIGLSARTAAADDNRQLQNVNASAILVGVMLVSALAKGILRARHPNRN